MSFAAMVPREYAHSKQPSQYSTLLSQVNMCAWFWAQITSIIMDAISQSAQSEIEISICPMKHVSRRLTAFQCAEIKALFLFHYHYQFTCCFKSSQQAEYGVRRLQARRVSETAADNTHSLTRVPRQTGNITFATICVHIFNSFSSAHNRRLGARQEWKKILFLHTYEILQPARRLAAVYCASDCVRLFVLSPLVRPSRGARNVKWENERCAVVDGWVANWRWAPSAVSRNFCLLV